MGPVTKRRLRIILNTLCLPLLCVWGLLWHGLQETPVLIRELRSYPETVKRHWRRDYR